MKTALLIIDVQNDYFPGGKAELSHPMEALANIEKVLAKFRAEQLPVIYVQHISVKEGATFFLPDTNGVLIHDRIRPAETDFLVEKHLPSSFLNTNLSGILRDNGVTELVICGMMTHMCVDTTVRACMDHGIKVILLEDACATKDLGFQGRRIAAETVHAVFMASLNGMFADVVKTVDYLKSIDESMCR